MLVAGATPALAIKPLVSGDVPTAPKGTVELFVGYLANDSGSDTEHEIPFWEVFYGVAEWQEITVEAPVLFVDGSGGSSAGFGDVVLGTKLRLLGEPAADSGLSASIEVKLPTGDESRSLGSGEPALDLLTRGGFQLGREVVYFNLGHTWMGESKDEQLDNPWFYAGVWDHPVGQKMRLLTEVYGKTSSDPEGPNLLAASVGI